MNGQEEKWFETSTWNHEKVVNVALQFTVKASIPSVYNVVKSYLESIGLRDETSSTLNVKQRSNMRTILVDMVDKNFKTISNLELMVMRQGGAEVPVAYPSQILLYMQSNRGMLTGKKFGL